MQDQFISPVSEDNHLGVENIKKLSNQIIYTIIRSFKEILIA